MNPFELIHRDLSMLGSTKGTNAKIEALREIDAHTVQVITWSFDPFHNFGVSKLRPTLPNVESAITDEQILTALGESDFKWLRNNCEDFSDLQLNVTNSILGRFQSYQLGIGGKSFRTVYKDAYKTFSLQLAGSYTKSKTEFPCYAQPKFDGVRCVVLVDAHGATETLSRNGKPLYNIDPEILNELSAYPNMVFDGEAITDGGDFNLSVGVIHRSTSDAVLSSLKLFDAITMEEFKSRKSTREYEERYAALKSMILVTPLAEHEIVNSLEEAEAAYNRYRKAGHEGAILKKKKGKYSFKRTLDWMKVKPLVEDSFEVTGFHEGRGRLKGKLGALIVKTQKGTTTKIGGGFSDRQREYLWEIRDQLIGEECEAEFMEYTPAGRLRHPEFLKMRFDKGEM